MGHSVSKQSKQSKKSMQTKQTKQISQGCFSCVTPSSSDFYNAYNNNDTLENNRKNNDKNDHSMQDEDYLYVILPYFNYCNFARRKELFIYFVNAIRMMPNIRIVIVEAKWTEDEHKETHLASVSDNVYMHIQCWTSDPVWVKESLINMGVAKLPWTWKYMAWIDADLTFLNKNWATETIEKLQQFGVVQLFQTCTFMGPMGETIKTDRSFAYMYLESGREYTKTYKYGFWHPGFAWACTRLSYQQMQGLIDWGILGSGDHHMALALIGKVNCSHPGGIHQNYQTLLNRFQMNVRGIKLGFVSGTILHHWHGSLENRRYRERWDILVNGKYDPKKDIYRTCNGLVQLSESGKRLIDDIYEYFQLRKEDDTEIIENGCKEIKKLNID